MPERKRLFSIDFFPYAADDKCVLQLHLQPLWGDEDHLSNLMNDIFGLPCIYHPINPRSQNRGYPPHIQEGTMPPQILSKAFNMIYYLKVK